MYGEGTVTDQTCQKWLASQATVGTFLIQKKKKLDKGQIYCVTTQSHLIWNFVGQESAF